MLHRKIILSVGLSLMLGACSTVDGWMTDAGNFFTGSSGRSGEVVQLHSTPEPIAAGTSPAMTMTYDEMVSKISNPNVELFSLDHPGQPVRSLTRPEGDDGVDYGMHGVQSSTDPSVTVFPFTEDMFTPGVHPNTYYGVRPVRGNAGSGYADAELLPMYAGNPNTIYFEHGSAALNGVARQTIASVAQSYNRASGLVTVEGHASQRAQAASPEDRIKINYRMSMKRAMAVTKALIKQGIPAHQIKTTALGDSKPAVPEVDRQAERLNRRVEIKTRP